ncbi:uncharacterized protein N7483_012791 [Penicillium malachiteum]|uniref:uncharacterized protein n=1 Tax=Penicillium malachiteum TaxID=1324776 RepID=UPI0025492586|nr:uncharacterized protein N7483_012791 [Penicillium malachiteum]KAJ5715610.1 hypothetical protein N7483_012791 [Penicillium malachiteum]
MCTAVIVGCAYGIGMKDQTLREYGRDHVERALICWWIASIFFCISCVMSRLGIACSLLRLTTHKTQQWTMGIVCFFATCLGLLLFVLIVTQCQPVKHFWELDESGKCRNPNILAIAQYVFSAGSIICDLILSTLLSRRIWQLQMRISTKLYTIFIFGLGSVYASPLLLRTLESSC